MPMDDELKKAWEPGLLNALDGISAQEGRILYATTNVYSAIDPALCRPGRMDMHIEFKLASKYQVRELFKRFYLPLDALKETQDSFDEKVDDRDDYEQEEERKALLPAPSSEKSDSEKPSAQTLFVGERHSKGARGWPRKTIFTLAEKFADSIPDHELSMAAIQGYLMMYKIRPAEAVKNVSEWLEKERSKTQKAST